MGGSRVEHLTLDRRSACALLLIALVVGASPASATFPGQDGRILFVRRDANTGDTDLYFINPDGSSVTNLTQNAWHMVGSPAWSPDSRRIAFLTNGRGDTSRFNPQIFVMDADGTDADRLTHSTPGVAGPEWSPDGRRIVFSKIAKQQSQIFTMRADGTDKRRLTLSTYASRNPSWHPSGRKILFDRGRSGIPIGSTDLFVMKRDGSRLRNLTSTSRRWELEGDWSPNGRRIVYVSFHPGKQSNSHIFVMGADGSNRRQITSGADYIDSAPRWSASGTRIVFVRDGRLQVMSANGSDMRTLDEPVATDSEPVWEPL